MVFFSSCTGQSKTDIKKMVEEWSYREIVFPNKPTFTRFAKDTVAVILEGIVIFEDVGYALRYWDGEGWKVKDMKWGTACGWLEFDDVPSIIRALIRGIWRCYSRSVCMSG